MKYRFSQVKMNFPFSQEEIIKEKIRKSKINVINIDLRHSGHIFNSNNNPLSASGNYHFKDTLNLDSANRNNINNINSTNSCGENNSLKKINNNNCNNNHQKYSCFNIKNNFKNQKTYSVENFNNYRNLANKSNISSQRENDRIQVEKMIEIVRIQKNIFSYDYSRIMSSDLIIPKKISLLYKIFKYFVPDSIEILKIIDKNSELFIMKDISSFLIEMSYLRENNFSPTKITKGIISKEEKHLNLFKK